MNKHISIQYNSIQFNLIQLNSIQSDRQTDTDRQTD